MDKITMTIEPLPFCAGLKDMDYESIKNVVQEMMKSEKYDKAACYLMRNLPKMKNLECESSSWYFDFLNACLIDSANRSIPEFIDPDYKTCLDDEKLECLKDTESIELRPCEQELVEAACRGINTIICAPTGSGKTVVAAHIILEHFRAMKAANKPR